MNNYRPYAAVLSGYTVALIATQQIDTPQHVFEASAITVGILSMAVANA